MKNKIKVIAGRPGAGKTIQVEKEISHLLTDPNNLVFYIGNNEPHNIPDELRDRLQYWGYAAASQAIGASIDCAYRAGENQRVYVYFEQCRFSMRSGRRDLLVAAAKAGVDITVVVQAFRQVDKGDTNWLIENCECMIVSKRRPPRMATTEEIYETYRG